MKKGIFKFLGLFSACAGITLTLASCGSNTMTYKDADGNEVKTTVTATEDPEKTAEAVYAVGQSYSENTVKENLKEVTAVKVTLNDNAVVKEDGKEVLNATVKGEVIASTTDALASGKLDFSVKLDNASMYVNVKGNVTLTSKDKIVYLDGSYTLSTDAEAKEEAKPQTIKYFLDTTKMTNLIPTTQIPDVEINASASIADMSAQLALSLKGLELDGLKSSIKESGLYIAGASSDTITLGLKGEKIVGALSGVLGNLVELEANTEKSTAEVKLGFSTKYYLPTELSAKATIVDTENANTTATLNATNTINFGKFTVAAPASTDGYTDLSALIGLLLSSLGGGLIPSI